MKRNKPPIDTIRRASHSSRIERNIDPLQRIAKAIRTLVSGQSEEDYKLQSTFCIADALVLCAARHDLPVETFTEILEASLVAFHYQRRCTEHVDASDPADYGSTLVSALLRIDHDPKPVAYEEDGTAYYEFSGIRPNDPTDKHHFFIEVKPDGVPFVFLNGAQVTRKSAPEVIRFLEKRLPKLAFR